MGHYLILVGIFLLVIVLIVLATDQSVRWQVMSATVEGPDGCEGETCTYKYRLERGNETREIRVDARTFLTYGVGMWCETPRFAIEPVSLNCYNSER